MAPRDQEIPEENTTSGGHRERRCPRGRFKGMGDPHGRGGRGRAGKAREAAVKGLVAATPMVPVQQASHGKPTGVTASHGKGLCTPRFT